MTDTNADKVAEGKRRERTTISFTGLEIIEALQPLISARLKDKFRGQVQIDIVTTQWTQRPNLYTSKEPIPPGYAPMTTDVTFTLEWDAVETEVAR